MNFLKMIFCKHQWVKVEESYGKIIVDSPNAGEYKMLKFQCTKCGKISTFLNHFFDE